MKDNYYCNCQAECIHKGKITRVIVCDSKGKHKLKAELCNNNKFSCTCKYRVKVNKAFLF